MSKSAIILLFVIAFAVNPKIVFCEGKGDKQITISPLNYYSDLQANSNKYRLDAMTFGLGFEYGLTNYTSILLPVQLSFQNQFIYVAPTIKFYRKKSSTFKPSLDISMVYNHGRQEVCHHIGPNLMRVIDIKRNRLGAFVGLSLNPKLSNNISTQIHGSLGTYLADNAKKYDGDSCGEFFLKGLTPRTYLGFSIAYRLNNTFSKKKK